MHKSRKTMNDKKKSLEIRFTISPKTESQDEYDYYELTKELLGGFQGTSKNYFGKFVYCKGLVEEAKRLNIDLKKFKI